VFPAIWPSPRAIGIAIGLAVALAVASAFPALTIVVLVASAIFLGALVLDVVLGPARDALRCSRLPLPALALGRTATLVYELRHRGAVAIRVVIFEAPVTNVTFAALSVAVRVEARSQTTASVTIVPQERGATRFGDLYLAVENSIGLLRRRYRVPAGADARVFPDLSAVQTSGRLARRTTLVDAGLRRLRLRGGTSEFESLREYVPGDGFRFVDWKATARRGRLMVSQYDIERSQNVIVALDCGRLMTPTLGRARKFDFALTAALSVTQIAQAASDNVGLIAFAARTLLDIAPRRGAAHARALAQASYDLQPRLEEPDYETTFVELRRRHGRRSLVILFTDISDPVTSAAVLAGLTTLVPRHLAMCVLTNDAAIENALDRAPVTAHDAFRTAVAMTLADERAKAIALLRARGIIVVDVPADKLTVALMDAYLDIKTRGLL
jgi:uncharacterized protein (DUF58 family)